MGSFLLENPRRNIEPTTYFFGVGGCLSCGVLYQGKIIATDVTDAKANFEQIMELKLRHRQDCVEKRFRILNLSLVSPFA